MTRVPADARELLEIAEFTDVITYELRGRRCANGADLPEPVPSVAARLQGQTFETRLRLEVSTADAKLFADVAAIYTLSEPVELEARVAAEFIERAGMMAVYPFAREALFTTASRLGVTPPVLGLLHAGRFAIGGFDDSAGADSGGLPQITPGDLASELGVSPAKVRAWLRHHGRSTGPSGRWELDDDTANEIRAALATD